ncbi:hypothetical protein HK096_000997, partial [Nowakowskiella sp. JEL0078]
MGSIQIFHNLKFLWYDLYSYNFIPNKQEFVHIPIPTKSKSKPRSIVLRDGFFSDTNSYRVWFDDIDFNLHMNNGRYASRIDLSRFQYGAKWSNYERDTRKLTSYTATAGTTYFFKKELRPFEKFLVQTRLLTWNSKWGFVEHRFLVKRSEKPQKFSKSDSAVSLDELEKEALAHVSKDIPKGYTLANGKTEPMDDVVKRLGFVGVVPEREELNVSDLEYAEIKKRIEEHNEQAEKKRAA